MVKADGISLLTKSTTVKVKLDPSGKAAGNIATNVNSYSIGFTAKILKEPTEVWERVSQADYNKIASRDDEGVKTGSVQSDVIPQQLTAFNLVETAKKLIPQVFETVTTDEAMIFIRQNIQSLTISRRMKTVTPNNQTIKIATYSSTADNWVTQTQESVEEFSDFSIQIDDQNFIMDEGFIYLTSYTDSSNGVMPAGLKVDYVGPHVSLSVNAQAVSAKSGFVQAEQLNTRMENRDNPHQVTAEQVGLSNAESYSFVSDNEAVAGTLANKYVHPKNVAETTKSQAVTQTGDQEIAGVKSFVTMPTVDGVSLESSRMAVYEADGVGKVEAKYQAAFNKGGMKFVLIRVGNRVDVFVRCNLSGPTKLDSNLVKVFAAPAGYTLSTKITKGIWNLTLTAMQYAFPQSNCAGLYEMGNRGILFSADRAGNIHLRGS